MIDLKVICSIELEKPIYTSLFSYYKNSLKEMCLQRSSCFILTLETQCSSFDNEQEPEALNICSVRSLIWSCHISLHVTSQPSLVVQSLVKENSESSSEFFIFPVNL